MGIIKLIGICFWCGLLFQCSSRDHSGMRSNLVGTKHTSAPSYTTKDLEGSWTLIKIETLPEKQSLERFKSREENLVMTEALSPVFQNQHGVLVPSADDFYSISNKDLYVHKDSIFWLDYPRQLKQRSGYVWENNQLKLDQQKDLYEIHLSAKSDTLVMGHLNAYGLYIKETYLKVNLDEKVISVLRKYTTNLPLYAGQWQVFREGNINNDGTEYTLNFPYKIPDVVNITSRELSDILFKGKTYGMLTNGQKKPYNLSYIGGQLILSPANWLPKNYSGDRAIYLDPLTKERQQLSPEECWKELVQVIRSGNIHATMEMMTDVGYMQFWKRIPHAEFELKLKLWGLGLEGMELKWENISPTNAKSTFTKADYKGEVEFIFQDGLWRVNKLKP